MSTLDTNNMPDQDDTGNLMPTIVDVTTLAIGEECGCWGCEPFDVYPPLDDGLNDMTTYMLGEEGGFCEDIWTY